MAKSTGGNSIIETTSALRKGPLSGALWAELHTFLAVAELGSVNQAAAHLRMHRAKVMRHLERLHDSFKQPLILLSPKGATLTSKGEELARQLRSLDHTIYSLEHDLRADERTPEGVVRIGISDGLAFIFLVPALIKFSLKYPRIKAQLRRPIPYSRLRDSQSDVIIGFEQSTGSDVISRPLGTVHFIPFAGEKYIADRGMPRLDNLRDHTFIGTDRFKGGVWQPWEHLCDRGHVHHSCDISVTYAFMVKAGLGIGLLPSYNVCDRDFVPLELSTRVAIRLHAVVLSARITSRAVRAVLDLLETTLGPANGWLADECSIDVVKNGDPIGYTYLLNLPPGGNAGARG